MLRIGGLLVLWFLSSLNQPDSGNPGATQSVPSGWGLTDDPILEIGPPENEGRGGWGKLVGVSGLSSGNIVVADEINRELSLYGPDGSPITHTGGSGEGPGEFRILMAPMLCGGDSVFVWDPALGRVAIYDENLRYVRQFRASELRSTVSDASGWQPRKMTCNRSGVYAITARTVEQLPKTEGAARVAMRVEMVTRDLVGTVVGPVSGDELYLAGRSLAPRPLGKRTSVALSEDRLFVGTADSFAVDVYSLRGEPLNSIVDDFPPIEVSRAHLNAYLSNQPEEHRSFYANLEYPGTLPAYSDLKVDPDGNLWIEVYRAPTEKDERSRWQVYDPQGRSVASLEMPEGFIMFEPGTDYVLGIVRDDMGVERVLMFGLFRTD